MYYIPRLINNYEEYKYNPDNNYFYDKCLPAELDDIADLSLKERMDVFNKNNMSLCESICTFKGYSYNNIICECGIKIKFNSFLNVNVSKYNLIYRFKESQSNSLNFWVLKCFFNLYTIDIIIKNICSIIIMVIIFSTLVTAFVFFIKEQGVLNNKIFMLIELTMKKEDDNNSDNSKNIYFSNDKIISDKLKNAKPRANQKKGTSKILDNNMNIGDINQQNNNSIENIYDKNKLIQIKKMKECSEYTDNELNNLLYYDAITLDKRSFIQIYFSLIKTKNLFVFAFGCKNDFNPRTMKISFMLSIFAIYLAFNTIFVTDSSLHELFISNGKVSIMSDISKIALSAFISGTIKNLLLLVIFPEKDILKIRKTESQRLSKRNQEIQKIISIVIIKSYIFFFVSVIILCLIWVYIACFFLIFQNTQIYVIRNTLISFGVSMIAPFILYLIPSLFRKLSIKGNETKCSHFFYMISTILQVIFSIFIYIKINNSFS